MSNVGAHFLPVTREVCRDSARFSQARGTILPASGRLARSARLCTPSRPRRLEKRTIEQRVPSQAPLPSAST